MDVIASTAARYERTRVEELSLGDYLAECKRNPLAYATARRAHAQGHRRAADGGHPQRPALSRIFANKLIKIYPAFAEFYGMEDAIEQVVSYFRHAAQGLEEKKQILYLLGPVGGGKSSIAERLKALMQEGAVLRLKGSPVNESPLGLFDPVEDGPILENEYGIPRRYLNRILSPWAVKRLEEFGGDIRRSRSSSATPACSSRSASAKTEPGDENNQDISLVGKVDIRKLETYAQDDPDAYSFSGGLCLANQGLLEFVEMFKAPDQGAAPAADRHAGGQLQGAPRALARSRSTASCWRTATRASGRPSATTRTTRPSSTASTSSRCRTACASRRGEDLREADPRLALAEATCAPAR